VIDKEEKAILFRTLKTILASVDMYKKPYTCHSKSWSGPPAVDSCDRQGGWGGRREKKR